MNGYPLIERLTIVVYSITNHINGNRILMQKAKNNLQS